MLPPTRLRSETEGLSFSLLPVLAVCPPLLQSLSRLWRQLPLHKGAFFSCSAPFPRGGNRQSEAAFAGDRWSPLLDLQKGERMDTIGAAVDFRWGRTVPGVCAARRRGCRSPVLTHSVFFLFYNPSVAFGDSSLYTREPFSHALLPFHAAATVKASPYLRATDGRPYGICKRGNAWTLSWRRWISGGRGDAGRLRSTGVGATATVCSRQCGVVGCLPSACWGDHWSPVFRFLRGGNRQSKSIFAGDQWSPLRDL